MFSKKTIGVILMLSSVIIIFCYLCFFMKVKNYNLNSYVIKNDYFAKLVVDKININNIIYNIGDIKNDVNKNIMLVKKIENLIVLASHSGNSPISYFNKLDKLEMNDKIELLINDRKKVYEIFKKEYITKNGIARIRKYSYPILVLITCDKNNKKQQIIYYSRLISDLNVAKKRENPNKIAFFCVFLHLKKGNWLYLGNKYK